jgi:hypothetical protein
VAGIQYCCRATDRQAPCSPGAFAKDIVYHGFAMQDYIPGAQ